MLLTEREAYDVHVVLLLKENKILLKRGILNPAINSLISRVRHTNALVIADRGFPFWPQVETVDISLTDDIPRVLDVLRALMPNFNCTRAYMAQQFQESNGPEILQAYRHVLGDTDIVFEPHDILKMRIPFAIGLIRTGDTTQYGNIVLESA